jgi:hypothetical protein
VDAFLSNVNRSAGTGQPRLSLLRLAAQRAILPVPGKMLLEELDDVRVLPPFAFCFADRHVAAAGSGQA